MKRLDKKTEAMLITAAIMQAAGDYVAAGKIIERIPPEPISSHSIYSIWIRRNVLALRGEPIPGYLDRPYRKTFEKTIEEILE
jgi:hypothetical protein